MNQTAKRTDTRPRLFRGGILPTNKCHGTGGTTSVTRPLGCSHCPIAPAWLRASQVALSVNSYWFYEAGWRQESHGCQMIQCVSKAAGKGRRWEPVVLSIEYTQHKVYLFLTTARKREPGVEVELRSLFASSIYHMHSGLLASSKKKTEPLTVPWSESSTRRYVCVHVCETNRIGSQQQQSYRRNL